MDHGQRLNVWVWGLLKRVVAENKVLRYSLFPFALEALLIPELPEGAKWREQSERGSAWEEDVHLRDSSG